jgi:predicted NUDIX family NTP pyrophosphohydrolase
MAGFFVPAIREIGVSRDVMPKRSAGLLLYRFASDGPEVLLVHPGGPFWARKDDGAWSIPKGEYADDEDPRLAALREFEEETGACPTGDLIPLGEVVQPGRKIVTAFALEGAFAVAALRSNRFEMEWPPRSGKRQSFPEVDRAGWFPLPDARTKILAGQSVFLDRLLAILDCRA